MSLAIPPLQAPQALRALVLAAGRLVGAVLAFKALGLAAMWAPAFAAPIFLLQLMTVSELVRALGSLGLRAIAFLTVLGRLRPESETLTKEVTA